MNASIKYYDILINLQELECQLYRYKNFEDFRELRLAILKAKVYIQKIDILKEEYFKRVNRFCRKLKKEQYKVIANGIYNKLKNLINNQKNHSRLNIFENDNIDLYYFPSLLFSNSDNNAINRSNINKNDITKLKISDSLDEFYDYILGENNEEINVPGGIEFYLAEQDIYFDFEYGQVDDIFKAFFYATCMIYVVEFLENVIEGKIREEKNEQTKQSELHRIIKFIKNNPTCSIRDIAESLVKSQDTIKIQLREICTKIYKIPVEDKNKGLKRVKSLIFK